MLELLAVLTPIALIDSTSVTPLGLVPLTAMLGRRMDGVAYFLDGPLIPIGFPGGSGPQSM
ncbi:MAG: hypothetical protein KAH56_02780 [Candidatus Krumholzibacteria bacterium]|nr:hypothetical protein [Candidatus Krumholzibacteria bacterium]